MSKMLKLKSIKYRGVGQGVEFISLLEVWSYIKTTFDTNKIMENHYNFLEEE